MKRVTSWTTLAAGLWFACGAQAQTTRSFTIQVSASVQVSPPSITLEWPGLPDATCCRVCRKHKDARQWGSPFAQLAGSAVQFTDTAVIAGRGYEYRLEEVGGFQAVGYIYCGIELPAREDRGKVILLVESGQAQGLAGELARLQSDLVGDGWQVLRHDVPETLSVPEVRALIAADHQADPNATRAVFVIGHVAVPYSGNINPDGHPDHLGAWPADVIYADVDGTYTDVSMRSTGASDPRQWNVPGDGKYDQSALASDAELEVGRVDMRNLPAFGGLTEQDLLRRYLDKDHAFRHKALVAEERGLVDDNFGVYYGVSFSAPAYGGFAAMFGSPGVVQADYATLYSGESYLWSYGCGGGKYTSASKIANTALFADGSKTWQSVFTFLFGSYFGDWDTGDNLMRSSLASNGLLLTCGWVGRPYWYVHHMALGDEIGYSARLSQNNDLTYRATGGYTRLVHIALLGDPTLRMHVVAPPSQLRLAPIAGLGSTVQLEWTAPTSGDDLLGYYIYRSSMPAGPFQRISPDMVQDTHFVDVSVQGPTGVYMVRAIALQKSASGTYYNLSQGLFSAEP